MIKSQLCCEGLFDYENNCDIPHFILVIYSQKINVNMNKISYHII